MRWARLKIKLEWSSAVGPNLVCFYEDVKSKAGLKLPGCLPTWYPSLLFVPPSLLWLAALLYVILDFQWPLWIIAG